MSFHTRLVLVITAVFMATGAGLLAVQNFVVQQLFSSAISMTFASCAPSPLAGGETAAAENAPVQATPTPEADDGASPAVTGCADLSGLAATDHTDGTKPAAPDEVIRLEDLEGLESLDGLENLTDAEFAESIGAAVMQQSTFLSDQVRSGLLIWSIVLLIAFAGVAAAIALWLAKRSLSRIREVTATARDISERDLARRLDLPGPDDEVKELGDTIDGMLDRLQSAFEAQDRFVANASHELRTPLTTTRTALEIPLSQGTVPPDLEPSVRRALRATQQSEELIAALLSLARSGARLDAPERLDLREVVESELADIATTGVHVDVDLRELTIDGDPVLVPRAVRNLVENAVLHNSDERRVWVRVLPSGTRAVIQVENTGPLLSPEIAALLTEPFYRGDATRTASGPVGTGLGLAIVEGIAAMHGGDLRLEPREGGGLTASLSIPLRARCLGATTGS